MVIMTAGGYRVWWKDQEAVPYRARAKCQAGKYGLLISLDRGIQASQVLLDVSCYMD